MTVVCSHVIPTTRMSFAIHEMGLKRGNVFSWEVIINENVNVKFFDWKPTLIKSMHVTRLVWIYPSDLKNIRLMISPNWSFWNWIFVQLPIGNWENCKKICINVFRENELVLIMVFFIRDKNDNFSNLVIDFSGLDIATKQKQTIVEVVSGKSIFLEKK